VLPLEIKVGGLGNRASGDGVRRLPRRLAGPARNDQHRRDDHQGARSAEHDRAFQSKEFHESIDAIAVFPLADWT
jgi:hypothetical protein